MPVYNPQKTKGHPPVNPYTKHNPDTPSYGKTKVGISGGGSTERYPIDVLEFAWDTYPVHPTHKPLELCDWFIKTYTNEGDTVLDLTTGYGSIPLSAIRNGRNFIAFDNGACEKPGKYFGMYWADLANDRIANYLNSLNE